MRSTIEYGRLHVRPPDFHARCCGFGSVWVGAATHDTGIVISQVTKWFTHSIDSNLDDERAKIVNDLAFAGAVKDVLYVDRPAAPRADENATGDKITTDGRMAVLAMK